MDIEVVLEKLAEEGLLRLNKKSGNYYQLYCPHHNNGNERRPSCGVLLDDEYRNGVLYKKGWWHCFSCGYTSTMEQSITDILRGRGFSQTGEDWLTKNISGYTSADSTPDDQLLPNELINSLQGQYSIETIRRLTHSSTSYISEEELASYRYVVPYMYERKLTDAIIEKYDVGYDANFRLDSSSKPLPCITFPVHDINGNTLFICRRAISKKLYHYPQGVTKPLYGIDKLSNDCRSVIIVESCINCLTAISYGYDCVALMGTGNAYQVEQLKQLSVFSYVLCLDGDSAGRKAAEKLKRQLAKSGIVWTMQMPDGKDVNDLSKEEFDSLYQTKQ